MNTNNSTIVFRVLPKHHKQLLRKLRVISAEEVIRLVAEHANVATPDETSVTGILGDWLKVLAIQVQTFFCVDAPKATYGTMIYLNPTRGMFVAKN